jgi:hypothetical protein
LQKTHDPQKNVLINAVVGFDECNSLDVLVDGEDIYIDGNDYHVWAAINSLRPKLVVIEFNPTIATPSDSYKKSATGSHSAVRPKQSVKLFEPRQVHFLR